MKSPKWIPPGVAVRVSVQHAKFGAGKVLELGGNFITVKFEDGEKKFMFPGAATELSTALI